MKTYRKSEPKHRVAAFLLCLCMIFIMVGCGDSSSKSPDISDSPESVGMGAVDVSSAEDSAKQDGAAKQDGSAAASTEAVSEELPTAVEEGCLAPDIELHYLDGSSAGLSDYRGKTVLLNFWATWCGPCVGEMPAFSGLQEEFGDRLQIIAVNCGDSADTVEQFAKDNDYTFPIALDEKYEIMMNTYRTSSIPYTVIIDEEGIIRHISVGAQDAETMFQQYKEAIEDAMKTE